MTVSVSVHQVLAYQTSGIKLGTLKSANETLTRAMVYVSLLALYCLGGSKVKAVSHAIYVGCFNTCFGIT